MSSATSSTQGSVHRIRKQLTRPAGCTRWGFQLSSVEVAPGELRTVITGIAPNTPSATSGFQSDDVIESANGQTLLNVPFDRVKEVFRERFLDIVCLRQDHVTTAAAPVAATPALDTNPVPILAHNSSIDRHLALASVYITVAGEKRKSVGGGMQW